MYQLKKTFVEINFKSGIYMIYLEFTNLWDNHSWCEHANPIYKSAMQWSRACTFYVFVIRKPVCFPYIRKALSVWSILQDIALLDIVFFWVFLTFLSHILLQFCTPTLIIALCEWTRRNIGSLTALERAEASSLTWIFLSLITSGKVRENNKKRTSRLPQQGFIGKYVFLCFS